jgi:predicted ATPase/DNA-binding SARP family transcriptional activator
VEVRVLGPVEVVGAGGPVRLATMPRRLLAALVVDRWKTRSVDVLVEALWGERPPRDAAKTLQLYVSRLRKALPRGAKIRTDTSGYALELDEAALDAARFERLLAEVRLAAGEGNPLLAASLLGRALSLWRGPAFGELACEDFARGEAERLEELRLLAVEEQSEVELGLGRHAAVLGRLRGLAVAHPLRERMQAQLMLALYRCGRQTDALDVFTAVRTQLSDELGLEPGDELRELQRRMLQHDPTLMILPAGDERQAALPVPPNRLLGRERELADLRRLLVRERVRLLVLTGAGGSGKTRLALEAASQLAGSFANGACLVELAPLRDPEIVLGAMTRALALESAPGTDPLETVAAALRRRELLLVLDNAEHVRAAAPLYVQLLARAPRLSLLVTSRAVLHVSGERVYPVEPLAEPAAVALFNERARQADPRFQPSGEDERAIREICRRLDGLPLALELAARRTRTLTPRELLDRLERRLPLLTGGPRDLPARQQTLRATLEWSYDLLGDDERRDLRRLAVFAGGCTLEVAETICETTIERLAALVEHNLLQYHTTHGGSRYAMLETIREYATEQLELTDDAEPLRRRHAEWCCELVETLFSPIFHSHRGDSEESFQRLDEEYDNIQAALAWARRNDEHELGLRLGTACFRFWNERGLFRDAVAWLEFAAPRAPLARPRVRLQALNVSGLIAFYVLGDTDRADRFWADAVTIAAQLGDLDEIAWLQDKRAAAAWERGELERALQLVQQSLVRVRDRRDRVGEAFALKKVGEVLRDMRRFDEAERALLDADAICREFPDLDLERFVARNTHSLGDLALDRGDLPAALSRYRRSIEELPDRAPGSLVVCLAGIASVLADRGLDHDAATMWGAVCTAEETLGFRMLPPERRRYECRLARFENTPAWFAGMALTLEEAVASIPRS